MNQNYIQHPLGKERQLLPQLFCRCQGGRGVARTLAYSAEEGNHIIKTVRHISNRQWTVTWPKWIQLWYNLSMGVLSAECYVWLWPHCFQGLLEFLECSGLGVHHLCHGRSECLTGGFVPLGLHALLVTTRIIEVPTSLLEPMYVWSQRQARPQIQCLPTLPGTEIVLFTSSDADNW